MSRSLSYLRRWLFGVTVAGSLTFGATVAVNDAEARDATLVCGPYEYVCECSALCIPIETPCPFC
jgi:hypothetical protein